MMIENKQCHFERLVHGVLLHNGKLGRSHFPPLSLMSNVQKKWMHRFVNGYCSQITYCPVELFN